MDDKTVIISSQELVDHTVLTRKRNELQFKIDFLARSGAKDDDLHLKAVKNELSLVDEKLKPVAQKLSTVDLLTILPNRKEINEFSKKINSYARGELDLAVKNKSGDAYDLMKSRAALVRDNFERREDIARMTVLINSFPRKEAESLCSLVEEGRGSDVDVSFLPKEKQQELVNLSSRLGRPCCVFAGSFSVDKKKVESSELKPAEEVKKTIEGGRLIWVEAGKTSEFDGNEKKVAGLLAKIQAISAEKQTRDLTEEEALYFNKIQEEYLDAKKRRSELVRGIGLDETVKVYKKVQPAQE